jgi:uncharacterized protein (TIGR03437 family)
MKYLALLIATAGYACAAEFATGQAARLVIGQDTFTSQRPGVSEFIVGAVSGLAYANDTLFVVDGSRIQADPQNNRVLIYRNVSGKLPGPKAAFALTDSDRCAVCGGVADVVLGQSEFTKRDIGLTRQSLRTPTAVASDGRYLAVADTDNNRVLIWNSIPTTNAAPADVVVGQPDFTSNGLNFGGSGATPSARGLRGPQGVWIQNGKLYVADTQNHRVLIWNSIPTQNGQEANVVLGKPNFTTFVEIDLTQAAIEATASTLLNPVSVTSDGLRLYVTDLGHNRVLIWSSLPTQNAQPADIALGQPDVTSTTERNAVAANNSRALCPSKGKDEQGNEIFPARCAATLDFPRFALSDGTRLFIADGGNDRVLVYNRIPTNSGEAADVVLGQLSDEFAFDSEDLGNYLSFEQLPPRSTADAVRTPMSLAWDGTNLYVSDPYNRRVMVFTPGDERLPYTGVRNAASQEIFAVGTVSFANDPKENDEVTLKIGDKEYKYKAAANHRMSNAILGLVEAVNGGAGDPLAFASPNIGAGQIVLTAKASGAAGNDVPVSLTFSTGAQLTGEISGATLRGGQDAAKIAPGSLIMVLGEDLANQQVSAPDTQVYPTMLGGVQVLVDGIPAPLLMVSPRQINAQMPFEVYDATSVSVYVRTEGSDGQVRISTPIAVPIIQQNPGIFAVDGPDPRPAIALHGSSFATGVVSVDGGIKEGDVATVTIDGREYKYTVTASDTLASIRDKLIAEIDKDEAVTASAAGVYTRILLRARVPGPEGEGIPYTAKANDGGNLILTALSSALCCASEEGSLITEANPARPGETIIVYATGLGFVQPDEAKAVLATGHKYTGPEVNTPNSPLDAIAGGKTANVLFAGLKPGTLGRYEVKLQLNPDIPTNPQTQLTIAQDVYVSNIVTFPVVNPNTPAEPEP